jgi:uncharacterized membrane protein
LTVIVWLLAEDGYDVGDTLLKDGGDATDVTVKLTVPEDWPSGLFTFTVQVPGSLPLLNW